LIILEPLSHKVGKWLCKSVNANHFCSPLLVYLAEFENKYFKWKFVNTASMYFALLEGKAIQKGKKNGKFCRTLVQGTAKQLIQGIRSFVDPNWELLTRLWTRSNKGFGFMKHN